MPKKTCNENQFHELSKVKDETNQHSNNVSTSNASQIVTKLGKGEISTKEWVYKSFHCQENKNMVPVTNHDKFVQQKVENLIHYQ